MLNRLILRPSDAQHFLNRRQSQKRLHHSILLHGDEILALQLPLGLVLIKALGNDALHSLGIFYHLDYSQTAGKTGIAAFGATLAFV